MSGIFKRKIYRRRVEQGAQIFWDEYTFPVPCFSTLYQACSGNTLETPILIGSYVLAGHENGYNTEVNGNGPVQDFVTDINKAVLHGSPESWQDSNILKLSRSGFKFYYNSQAREDGTAYGIMEAFNVNMEQAEDVNYDFFIDKVNDPGHRIGYSDFAVPSPLPAARGSKNIRGSLSMSGNQAPERWDLIPYFMYQRCYVPVTEGASDTDKHFNCSMLIWPDKIAGGVDSYETGGKYDFNKLDNIPGGTTKMICELRLLMWQSTNDTGNPGTWFWEAYVVPHEISVNHWNFLMTYLQGEDTGKKYNLGDDTGDDGDLPPGIPETPPDLIAAGGYNAYKIADTFLPTLFNFLNAYTPLDSLVKMWSKPAEGIISLHLVPFDAHVAASRVLSFHGVPIVYPVDSGTTLSAPTVEQWQEWDMGTVRIPTPSDYLGYSPYTNVSIFLPFIGMRQLDADEVVGHRINIQYRIDIITGAVTAWISVDGGVRYTFSGACACSMPLSGTDWAGVYSAIGSAALSAITGGLGAASSIMEGTGKIGLAAAGGIGAGVANGLIGATQAKPIYQRIGSMGNTSALNSCKEPYIIIESQDSAKPNTYEQILGNPASKSVSLSSLSGFAQVENLYFNNSQATDAEVKEIESLLSQGVFF